jgi:OmpA-OmpF porin, OOP family
MRLGHVTRSWTALRIRCCSIIFFLAFASAVASSGATEAAPLGSNPLPQSVPAPTSAVHVAATRLPNPIPRQFVLFFGFRSADLTPRAKELAKLIAESAIARGTNRIIVTGHSDTVGSLAYNQALSMRRAEAVRAEIVRNGYGGGIVVAGKSYTSPLVKTGPNVAEPQNRRVVVELES